MKYARKEPLSLCKMMWGKKEAFGEKPVPVLLCPPQIPHRIPCGSNPHLFIEKPATNHPSYGMAPNMLMMFTTTQKEITTHCEKWSLYG
jgi:hypothetical protein